jgi:hypothetical protein
MTRSNLLSVLAEIRERLAAASPAPWTVETDSNSVKYIRVGAEQSGAQLSVKRDQEPGDDADVEFIAMSRNVLPRLVSALDGKQRSVTIEELDMIDAVANRATPGPWTAFIEEVQPIGGPSVIWVGGDDDPDMYLWFGTKIASPGDVNFVAHAREDVPTLVEAIRARLHGTREQNFRQ